jgi:hypothetical protein
MRTLFFAALMLLWVSYALIAQNTLPDSVNFSTITIPSIMQGRLMFSDTSYSNGRLFNIWNHGEGSPTNLNKYYRMQGSYNFQGHREIANPSVCFSDTSYLQLLFGYQSSQKLRRTTLTARNSSNLGFGIALHYDVCAPNRSRTVAGTNTSYQETYPDWTDPSGGAFGFLTRNSGADSVFADNNKRRVYHPSTTSAGTLILSHPFPNDELITDKSNSLDNSQNNSWGKELFLSFNLRRLDTVAGNANDTVLILRIAYTTKPGMGPLVTPTHYIVFDRVPHPTNNPTQITATRPPTNRGLAKPLQTMITDSIIITRAMLGTAGTDITFSAHFNLKGDQSQPKNGLDGAENHFLWSEGKSASDTATDTSGRIKRIEPEIIYKGNCSIALDWVRLETPHAQIMFRGAYDDFFRRHIDSTIRRLRDGVGDYPIPNPWLGAYQGNIRWHRVWLLEEDSPRTYHAIGYLNHLFGGRGMSETGYTTQWGFREFDDNGNAIDATDITGQWRAAQMRYYTEHYARETNIRECWRGDTYSVTGTNAAPFVWKSSDTADINIGMTRGYFGGASGNWYNWDNFSYSSLQNNIEYRYHQRWTPSSLANIEAFSCKYATDPFMLFDTKRMYLSSVWAAPQYYLSSGYDTSTIANCIPGITCPRTAKLFNSRQNSGEELRFTQWFARVLGMKGQATWSFQAKAIASSWQDSLVLPSPTDYAASVIAWSDSYLGPHSYLQVMAQPPDTATNLSWYKNNSLGTDYFEINDPTRLDLFVPARSAIASTWGVQQDKIYFGRKTIRHELKKYQELTYTHDTTFARLDLDYWYGKGFRTFNTSRNGAKHNFFNRKIDTTKIFTRHIYFDTTLWKYSVSLPEPIDSSFCDITMLRDRTKNDTNEFYVGVLNRRLDPVFTIPIADTLNFGTTYADTTISTTKRYCFLPTVEFDSLLTLAAHPLIANKTVHRYCQFGAREITIPFKVSGRDAGDYPLLRIQEMGGTLDTVIGCDKPLAMKYLPGEGKIFRVRLQYPDRFTGDLAHSNQTKLVAHSIMRHDSVQNKWVEGDSVVYHAVYHKKIVGASARTGVYYRVSKPIAIH